MNDILTEVRFWSMVGQIAKRTIICSPELESRVKGYIDARGLGHLLTVNVSRVCPDTRIYVIDEDAGQAAMNELLSRPINLF